MARATKGGDTIGRGAQLPDPDLTSFDAFIVENTLDAVGEPDGLYHLRLNNWIRDAGTGATAAAQIGTGNQLPDPVTTTFRMFVIENTLDPVGEPNGLYFLTLGNWVSAN